MLQGCGGSSEPPSPIPQDTNPKKEAVEVTENPKQEILEAEQNTTVTHIRVLGLDEKSKIPEYLIKIPIYQN